MSCCPSCVQRRNDYPNPGRSGNLYRKVNIFVNTWRSGRNGQAERGTHVKPWDDRNHVEEASGSGCLDHRLMGRNSRRMPCCAIGYNMGSNGESVMHWTGKWHGQIFILEISLWLQCGNWLVVKAIKGAEWLDRKLLQLSRRKMVTMTCVGQWWWQGVGRFERHLEGDNSWSD